MSVNGRGPKTILVAESSSDAREFIRVVLELGGHTVVDAPNGVEAVRLALEVLPDLIVMDLAMPLMNGVEVLRRLRLDSRLANTPMVPITPGSVHTDRAWVKSVGFSAYICKPIGLIALRTELKPFLA